MKKIIFTMLCLFCFCSTKMNAQVVIGSSEEPQKFSILELNGNGQNGLRIPQLTSEERDKLTDSKDFMEEIINKAKGLLIFNTTTHSIQYWNGKLWTEL